MIACDIDTPLLGPTGAAAVFGPQKCAPSVRANPERLRETVQKLEHNLASFSQVVAGGRPLANMKGMGAAGGFGLGFCALANAKLESGSDFVLKTLEFEQYQDFDVVFTSEGLCDGQTLQGKAPHAVCRWMKKPFVVVLCGGVESASVERKMLESGANLVLPICDGPIAIEESMRRTSELMTRAACRSFYSYLSGRFNVWSFATSSRKERETARDAS
jgi:glycerate kinase